MKKLLLIPLLSILLLLPGFSQEYSKLDDAFRLMEVWLDAQKDFERLPGIAVAVVNDQEILWDQGFGYADINAQIKTETSTIYSICSISKLFTAIAILQLRDEGKLQLDDEVATHLPWFKIKQNFEQSGPITIRGLLTHSSGLPRQSNYPYWTGPDFDFPTLEEIKSQMDSSETLYPASTYFQYSNFGMSLLGAIIEEKSGITYETYVTKHIIEPLKLKDTRPRMPDELAKGQLATGYSALNRQGEREALTPFFTKGVTAAAGFTSTVEDLSKFASWQFRLLNNGEKEVLKSSTLKEMQRVHWMDPDWKRAWGLGFSVRNLKGTTLVSHGGSCPGYRSLLSLVPKYKKAYSVMINAGSTNPGKYIDGISEILVKAFDAKPVTTPEGVDLNDYAGIYNVQPWAAEEAILPWFGQLIQFELPTSKPANFSTFKYVKKDTFRRVRSDGSLGEEIIFERDTQGNVYRMLQHQNYSPKIK